MVYQSKLPACVGLFDLVGVRDRLCRHCVADNGYTAACKSVCLYSALVGELHKDVTVSGYGSVGDGV